METIYTVSKNKTGSYESDHELLIAKFRLILKKVGKTTRPFGYDLNQIPYNYIVGVINRFFMRIDLVLSSKQSAMRPGAELLIAKFRLILKK